MDLAPCGLTPQGGASPLITRRSDLLCLLAVCASTCSAVDKAKSDRQPELLEERELPEEPELLEEPEEADQRSGLKTSRLPAEALLFPLRTIFQVYFTESTSVCVFLFQLLPSGCFSAAGWGGWGVGGAELLVL